ncbi:DUF1858 domain-containing protein [Tranquillimonas alkanivorans]|uniref:Hybrid cluster protein-associated redox disulfide domain-containing protein n=1 Tax=Tranquillimonas alkanivorans TaxID=441119 RepID=A0A1I5X1F9_9RHOB|nr:DUF1858 domain-containing protein [Tranquillimonas alkanivorans]SFQ25740.1 hybrid cluster protein-associated redox disulfide domain-containing protein [Tranquillimonas alkanivorans]
MPIPRLDDLDLPLEDLMREWPETIRVFLDYRMLCVGCPIAPFHTVIDACFEHEVDEEEFRTALAAACKADAAS